MMHNTIQKLALGLPGGNTVTSHSSLKPQFVNLASFITPLLNVIFYIAGFFAFYWLIWGSFQYLMARGEKEGLAKARARITWALIGLLFIFMSFFIAKYASEVFPPLQIGGSSPVPNPSGVPF